jgi:phospholipid/cholesterol/gamma-HCH transport system substrate-binding protein
MRKNAIETIMGAVVLVVAAFFVVFAYSSADIAAVKGYEVTAKFDRVDGIRQGTDVRLSGIKVGTVVKEKLEPETYFAVVTISVDNAVKLPTDTSAKIVSDGLLGNKYIALEPGADEKMLAPDGEITHTQSAINLEDLVSRYIFSSSGSKKGEKGKEGAQSPSDQAPAQQAPAEQPAKPESPAAEPDAPGASQ